MQWILVAIALILFVAALPGAGASAPSGAQDAKPPYPPSPVIAGITWHLDTYRTAAPGSDLWPVTWAVDDNLYTAWGDGGGFGGTDSEGRVAMGFARIQGPPERFLGINVNGGMNPEHPASFPERGKTGGILAAGGTLYAWVNLQDGDWPHVDVGLVWSRDRGATWQHSSWVFPKGAGHFKPSTFLNFGRDYSGVPGHLKGFAYFYGQRQGQETEIFMGRVPVHRMQERDAYEFLSGFVNNQPVWSPDASKLYPIFTDARGCADLAGAVYNPGLQRYLLTSFHKGPGQLGLFDGPEPWGPWTTVAYYEDWGHMGAAGEGLTCSFPQKWLSADGRTAWCVFSVYGGGAKQGINAHDRFNLVQATFTLRSLP